MVGETTESGVPYSEFLARDMKMHDVMFGLIRYGPLDKEDLTELHVSHGGGLSGKLERTRPARRSSIPYSTGKTAPRKDRHIHVEPTMSLAKLFQGLPPRSHSRSQSRASSKARHRGQQSGTDSELPKSFTSQFSRLPEAPEKLLKTRSEAIPIRRVEKREKVDRDFVSQFSFDVEEDAEIYAKVLYGPLPVRAQSDSRSIKVRWFPHWCARAGADYIAGSPGAPAPAELVLQLSLC